MCVPSGAPAAMRLTVYVGFAGATPGAAAGASMRRWSRATRVLACGSLSAAAVLKSAMMTRFWGKGGGVVGGGLGVRRALRAAAAFETHELHAPAQAVSELALELDLIAARGASFEST